MQGKTFTTPLRTALAVFALTLFTAHTAASQEQVLYSFYDVGGAVLPVAGVISDAAGNLYGTTFYGGTSGNGMVFELSPAAGGWTQTILHSFNFDGIDGAWATGGLVFDAAGNLYGTTQFGGNGGCSSVIGGCGTVFELSPTASGEWTETILHSFQGPDGFQVHAGLIIDGAGNLYGTPANGGAYSQGVAFELSPSSGGTWTETTLHSFTGGGDGGVPYGNLLLDARGNLYGLTSAGGGPSSVCRYGCGTAFELKPTASGRWVGKVLHNFSRNINDGHYPYAGLIFDRAGNLYGSTLEGGGTGRYNRGMVFELTPIAGSNGKWTEKVLYNFNEQVVDGINPSGTLVFDASGNLYGGTLSGGSNGQGTVFELTPTASGPWTETVLHGFGSSGTNGANPNAGLIFDPAGNLYGTTGQGGSYNEGAVFEITP
jgi:uncharacterized repeat protein (TIGR03803 family)